MERRNNFDLLRLLAAISVIFSHAYLIAEGTQDNEPFYRLTGQQSPLGVVGVFIFFTMSGFLVTQSFETTKSPLRYAAKRLLRIYPGYIACLLVLGFVLGPLVTSLPLAEYLSHPRFRTFLIWNLMMDPNQNELPGVAFTGNPVGQVVDGPLWTLPCELMMYALVMLLGMARLLTFKMLGFLLVIGLICIGFDTTKSDDLMGSVGWLMPFFVAGVALYKLQGTRLFDGKWALLALVGLILSAMVGKMGLPFPPFILLFPIFGSYLTIWLALNQRLPVIPAAKFGDFSYGLYIYGWPAEQLLAWISGGTLATLPLFLGALVLSLGLSALSWHLIEKRALRLKPRPDHSASSARPAGVSLQTSQSGFKGLENQGSAQP